MAPGGNATVHLLCGLNGGGKTTLAQRLADELPAVRFTLDQWMIRLHGLRYDDPGYAERADSCKDVVWETAQQVLRLGHDVVLDWNQWSRTRRAEWRDRAEQAGHRAVLHFVDVSLDEALARMARRNAMRPESAHVIDEAGVRHLAALFEPPSADEGMEIRAHSG